MKSNVPQKDATIYTVESESELLSWLLENVKGLSKNKIKLTLKGKGVEVDGKVVSQYNFPLQKGMKISLSRSKKNRNLQSPFFQVVYEDRHLIVVDKSEGILSMVTNKGLRNLKTELDHYFMKSGQRCNAHVVHRLDRDTSGLMIYAKSVDVQQELVNHWQELVNDRRYIAVLSGEVEQHEGTISSWLKDDKSFHTYSSETDNGGKFAVTHFYVLESNRLHSLVEFALETGRKNQVRVHAAVIGHPVCGDLKYGNGDNPIQRLCLHACSLSFLHPVTRRLMEFDTPVPGAFLHILR